MTLFDVNVGLGRAASAVGGAFDTPEELRVELRRLRIDEALVHHQLAAEADIDLGNRLVSEALQDHPDLHTCWVMAPPALGDLADAEIWVRDAMEFNVRGVRMFPVHSLFTPAPWCIGGMASALSEARLPLFLDFGRHHWSKQCIPWGALKELCETYPELSVVVIGTTIGEIRDVCALLAQLPNLHMEYGAFNPPDALGLMAERGLASQLLFGTGMPVRPGECVLAQTLDSGLKPNDLEAIASGNARRLLRIDEPVGESLLDVHPVTPVPGVVVDAHGHYGCWERTITPVRSGEAIVASMKRCGIHKFVASSFAAIHGEMRIGNAETAGLCKAYPDNLYGYCAINPHYPEEIGPELKRCFEEAEGFVGLKFHCMLHESQLHDDGYTPALEFANEHELPILVHAGGRDDWEGMSERYPNANFILAHACSWDGFNPVERDYYAMAKHLPNIYLDVAGSGAFRGALRKLVDLVGLKKVVYGSDFPLFDFAFELGRVTLSDLGRSEQVALCGGNAARLYKRMTFEDRLWE
jgi:hypothetical protein